MARDHRNGSEADVKLREARERLAEAEARAAQVGEEHARAQAAQRRVRALTTPGVEVPEGTDVVARLQARRDAPRIDAAAADAELAWLDADGAVRRAREAVHTAAGAALREELRAVLPALDAALAQAERASRAVEDVVARFQEQTNGMVFLDSPAWLDFARESQVLPENRRSFWRRRMRDEGLLADD